MVQGYAYLCLGSLARVNKFIVDSTWRGDDERVSQQSQKRPMIAEDGHGFDSRSWQSPIGRCRVWFLSWFALWRLESSGRVLPRRSKRDE